MSNFGFKKDQRLLKKREFDHTFQTGRKYVSPHLVVFACPQKNERNRLGLVVSKKVGNAIKRNSVKRKIREAFRQELGGPETKSLDVVVVARHTSAKATSAEIRSSLVRCYRKIAEKYEF